MYEADLTYIVDGVGGLVSRHFPEAKAYERHIVAGSQFDARDGHDDIVEVCLSIGI